MGKLVDKSFEIVRFMLWSIGVIITLLGFAGTVASFVVTIMRVINLGFTAENILLSLLMWIILEVISGFIFSIGYVITFLSKKDGEECGCKKL